MRSSRPVRTVVFAVFASLLIVTATPAAASSHTQLVAGSRHSNNTEFNAATTLDNLVVSGGSVVMPSGSYNVVDGSGDGTAESSDSAIYGDSGGDAALTSELRAVPDFTGEVRSISINIASVQGSQYPTTVDVYAVQETPDKTYGEGVLIKSNWNPAWTTGTHEIYLDNTFSVSSGETWTIEFVTDSSDNDGTNDQVKIATDENSGLSGNWWTLDYNTGSLDGPYAGDLTLSETPDSATYVSQAHAVDSADEFRVNIAQLSNAEVTVTWQGSNDGGSTWDTNQGSTTYTTAGVKTESVTGYGSSYDRFRVKIEVQSTGSNPQFELGEESVWFTDHEPTIDNASASPSGGTVITNSPLQLSIDVGDQEFGIAQGESVTVTFYDASDNSVIGTDTLSSNGTATTSWDWTASGGGTVEWYAVAEDSYGLQTTSQTFTFTAPSTLRVVEETSPSTLVDNVTLTVRFFSQDNDTVVEREVTDGNVSLTGLPLNQSYVVTVDDADTDQYYYRRIIIDSVFDQSTIYLLNTSKQSNEVVFELDDPTGQFPPEETILYVERPIRRDYDGDGTNETRYETIAGDTFGASGRFPVQLQSDSRYRLRVETQNGTSSRILGAYSTYADTVEPLQIQRVEPSGDTQPGAAVYGGITESGGQKYLAVRYIDDANATQSVEYRVLYENGSVFVANTTRTADSFADLYLLPVNGSTSASYTVQYTIVRDSGTVSDSWVAGQVGSIAGRFNIDPQVLSIASWFAILATMGLVVLTYKPLTPLSGAAMASALTIIGTVAIPAPMLGVSGAIGVLVLFGGRS